MFLGLFHLFAGSTGGLQLNRALAPGHDAPGNLYRFIQVLSILLWIAVNAQRT